MICIEILTNRDCKNYDEHSTNIIEECSFYLKETGLFIFVVTVRKNKLQTYREQEGQKGHVSGFEELIEYVNNLLSRNEMLASFMRGVGICEERGSGFFKVVSSIEAYQLPALFIEVVGDHTRITLFSYKTLNEMLRMEKIHASYLHVCLKYVTREQLTNASLRERFGLKDIDNFVASRTIRDAVSEGKIKPFDSNATPRYMNYIPYWA